MSDGAASETWAAFGADLHLDLGTGHATAGGRAAYGTRTALTDAVRDAIRTGRLTPGSRLPSSRSLAADLGLARNTVAGAYAELVAEGWLSARQGSGSRVAHRAQPPTPRGPRAAPRTRPGLPGQERRLPRPAHDLRTGSPDVSAFPRSAWLASARRALTAAPARAFSHGDHRGTPGLRRALADYLARARGVRVACLDGGERDGGEREGRGRESAGPGGGGSRVTGSGGDGFAEGFRAGAAAPDVPAPAPAAHLAGVRAALLTPGHQYPTGVPLHPDRRAAVLRAAHRRGVALDGLSSFRHPQAPPLPEPRPALVVGYGTPAEHAYPAALDALCGALTEAGA